MEALLESLSEACRKAEDEGCYFRMRPEKIEVGYKGVAVGDIISVPCSNGTKYRLSINDEAINSLGNRDLW